MYIKISVEDNKRIQMESREKMEQMNKHTMKDPFDKLIEDPLR